MTALAGVFFPRLELLGRLTPVGANELPEDYQALLAHHDHMTVTLEAFHGSLVDVHVKAESKQADSYARKSVLTRQSDGGPVQLGVMRIETRGLPALVREQIEQHSAPLGRILIRNNLLREVELLALWRIDAGPELSDALQAPVGETVYGRSARILVDGHAAVELLEIVKA